jgi:hypothetical protein
MRFFTSFHYVQNGSKCESIQEPVIPMRSEESHKINRTVLISNKKILVL